MSISKRIILVTGANKGIGLETARQLGKQGHTILVGVREAARAEATAAQLRAEGVDAVPLAIDVVDAASVKKAAAQVQERYGKLDSLINNAGIATEGWGVKTISAVSTIQSFAQATTVTQFAQKGAMKVIPYLIPSGDLPSPRDLLAEKNRPYKRGDTKKHIFSDFMSLLGRAGFASRYFLSISYRDGSSGHAGGLRGQEKIAMLGYVDANTSINFEQIAQLYF